MEISFARALLLRLLKGRRRRRTLNFYYYGYNLILTALLILNQCQVRGYGLPEASSSVSVNYFPQSTVSHPSLVSYSYTITHPNRHYNLHYDIPTVQRPLSAYLVNPYFSTNPPLPTVLHSGEDSGSIEDDIYSHPPISAAPPPPPQPQIQFVSTVESFGHHPSTLEGFTTSTFRPDPHLLDVGGVGEHPLDPQYQFVSSGEVSGSPFGAHISSSAGPSPQQNSMEVGLNHQQYSPAFGAKYNSQMRTGGPLTSAPLLNSMEGSSRESGFDGRSHLFSSLENQRTNGDRLTGPLIMPNRKDAPRTSTTERPPKKIPNHFNHIQDNLQDLQELDIRSGGGKSLPTQNPFTADTTTANLPVITSSTKGPVSVRPFSLQGVQPTVSQYEYKEVDNNSPHPQALVTTPEPREKPFFFKETQNSLNSGSNEEEEDSSSGQFGHGGTKSKPKSSAQHGQGKKGKSSRDNPLFKMLTKAVLNTMERISQNVQTSSSQSDESEQQPFRKGSPAALQNTTAVNSQSEEFEVPDSLNFPIQIDVRLPINKKKGSKSKGSKSRSSSSKGSKGSSSTKSKKSSSSTTPSPYNKYNDFPAEQRTFTKYLPQPPPLLFKSSSESSSAFHSDNSENEDFIPVESEYPSYKRKGSQDLENITFIHSSEEHGDSVKASIDVRLSTSNILKANKRRKNPVPISSSTQRSTTTENSTAQSTSNPIHLSVKVHLNSKGKGVTANRRTRISEKGDVAVFDDEDLSDFPPLPVSEDDTGTIGFPTQRPQSFPLLSTTSKRPKASKRVKAQPNEEGTTKRPKRPKSTQKPRTNPPRNTEIITTPTTSKPPRRTTILDNPRQTSRPEKQQVHPSIIPQVAPSDQSDLPPLPIALDEYEDQNGEEDGSDSEYDESNEESLPDDPAALTGPKIPSDGDYTITTTQAPPTTLATTSPPPTTTLLTTTTMAPTTKKPKKSKSRGKAKSKNKSTPSPPTVTPSPTTITTTPAPTPPPTLKPLELVHIGPTPQDDLPPIPSSLSGDSEYDDGDDEDEEPQQELPPDIRDELLAKGAALDPQLPPASSLVGHPQSDKIPSEEEESSEEEEENPSTVVPTLTTLTTTSAPPPMEPQLMKMIMAGGRVSQVDPIAISNITLIQEENPRDDSDLPPLPIAPLGDDEESEESEEEELDEADKQIIKEILPDSKEPAETRDKPEEKPTPQSQVASKFPESKTTTQHPYVYTSPPSSPVTLGELPGLVTPLPPEEDVNPPELPAIPINASELTQIYDDNDDSDLPPIPSFVEEEATRDVPKPVAQPVFSTTTLTPIKLTSTRPTQLTSTTRLTTTRPPTISTTRLTTKTQRQTTRPIPAPRPTLAPYPEREIQPIPNHQRVKSRPAPISTLPPVVIDQGPSKEEEDDDDNFMVILPPPPTSPPSTQKKYKSPPNSHTAYGMEQLETKIDQFINSFLSEAKTMGARIQQFFNIHVGSINFNYGLGGGEPPKTLIAAAPIEYHSHSGGLDQEEEMSMEHKMIKRRPEIDVSFTTTERTRPKVIKPSTRRTTEAPPPTVDDSFPQPPTPLPPGEPGEPAQPSESNPPAYDESIYLDSDFPPVPGGPIHSSGPDSDESPPIPQVPIGQESPDIQAPIPILPEDPDIFADTDFAPIPSSHLVGDKSNQPQPLQNSGHLNGELPPLPTFNQLVGEKSTETPERSNESNGLPPPLLPQEQNSQNGAHIAPHPVSFPSKMLGSIGIMGMMMAPPLEHVMKGDLLDASEKEIPLFLRRVMHINPQHVLDPNLDFRVAILNKDNDFLKGAKK